MGMGMRSEHDVFFKNFQLPDSDVIIKKKKKSNCRMVTMLTSQGWK